MPTGIVGCKAKVNREDFRKKYGIPDNAFVISYAGRHNEIKGYADLKRLGEKLLADKNVYFLIAGKEEPMTGLKNDHWIEVGWTNDPQDVYKRQILCIPFLWHKNSMEETSDP